MATDAAPLTLTPELLDAARRGDKTVGASFDTAAIIAFGNDIFAGKQAGPEAIVLDREITPAERDTGLVLFNNRTCPFGHRAWWSISEKVPATEYKYFQMNLGPSKPEWYSRLVNPSGTVPCIYEDGVPVFESSVVVEYLEDKFPGVGTALMPAAATARGAVRAFVKMFNENIPKFYKVLMNQDPAKHDELVADLTSVLEKINTAYEKQSSGPYFLGDEFSAADVNLVPFLLRFSSLLPYYRGLALLPEGTYPRLTAVLEACKGRPAFQATTPPPEYFIAAYYKYAAPKE